MEADNIERTVWAIVDSGTRRLVGRIREGVKPGDVDTVCDAVELDANKRFFPTLVPIDAERGPVDVMCLVASVRYFTDMKLHGAEYKVAYKDLIDHLARARDVAANLATIREAPVGGEDPSPIEGGRRD
jgi:hypothetical protein